MAPRISWKAPAKQILLRFLKQQLHARSLLGADNTAMHEAGKEGCPPGMEAIEEANCW
jgi:hypothetical protein